MLIQALCEYADKQSGTDNIPEGFAEQDIHYRIVLSPEGDLLEIVPSGHEETITGKNGKEKMVMRPEKAVLPVRTQKTSIDSNYIEHRPLYIFGLNYSEDRFTTDDNTNKAKKSHEAFVSHELEFFNDLDSPICIAYRKFIEKWDPENGKEHPALMQHKKDYKGSYFGFCFGIGREKLEEDEQFRNKYIKFFRQSSMDRIDSAELAVCGITGERLPLARIHDKIKFPGGQSSGCQLVCMKENAYESYGKVQSFNSSISEIAMKKYTSILNRLLSDKKHHIVIGDMVIVYFAMKNNDEAECNHFMSFLGNDAFDYDEKSHTAEEAESEISNVLKNTKRGLISDAEAVEGIESDPDVTFYIVGFTPNSARISQKFIYRDKFGNLMKNTEKHQTDLKINEKSDRSVYFRNIAKELISLKSTGETIPSPLMTDIMLAAFYGIPYPDGMLASVIRRVKTDSNDDKNQYIKINDTRAGIIKACLNRKYKKEEITMAWNEENKNQAYICGGLFAIYEVIQKESSGGTLNRTITDSYFASACSRPASVFPKLGILAMNHMRKINEMSYIRFNKLIEQLMDDINGEFPATLSNDDQGRFIVGYYQMNRKIYTSDKAKGKDE